MPVHTFANRAQLEKLITQMGILPFFRGLIPDFSIEEYCPASLWFDDEADGPWEWKGPMIIDTGAAYGKLFGGKAAYVSMDLYPDLVNMRRAAYVLRPAERALLAVVQEHEGLLSRELKRLGGYGRRAAVRHNALEREAERAAKLPPKRRQVGGEGFETAVTRLQMGGRLVIADFEYNYDRTGRRYGWGVARYATPEGFFGPEALDCGGRTPRESYNRLMRHLERLLPTTPPALLQKFLL